MWYVYVISHRYDVYIFNRYSMFFCHISHRRDVSCHIFDHFPSWILEMLILDQTTLLWKQISLLFFFGNVLFNSGLKGLHCKAPVGPSRAGGRGLVHCAWCDRACPPVPAEHHVPERTAEGYTLQWHARPPVQLPVPAAPQLAVRPQLQATSHSTPCSLGHGDYSSSKLGACIGWAFRARARSVLGPRCDREQNKTCFTSWLWAGQFLRHDAG